MTTASYTLNGVNATIFLSPVDRHRIVVEALADHCGSGCIPGALARTLTDRGVRPRHLRYVLQDLVDTGRILVRRVAEGVVHIQLVDPDRTGALASPPAFKPGRFASIDSRATPGRSRCSR